jgi:hypothetical protein
LYDGTRNHDDDMPFLKGGDFTRYSEPTYGKHWLKHDYHRYLNPDIDTFRFSEAFLLVPEKIVYRQTADQIVATIDRAGNLVDKTVHVVLFKEGVSGYLYEYLLALLNSRLMNYIYRNLSEEEDRAFAQVKIFRMKQIPIYRVAFETSVGARAALFDEACLMLTSGDQVGLLGFIAERLSCRPGQSDVVHDVLARLAQQMLDLHKGRRVAQNAFSDWLRDTQGLPVETFSPKTFLDTFDEHTYAEFAAWMKRNRHEIRFSDDRTYRDAFTYAAMNVREFEMQIRIMDRLIDRIVYALYGLTEDEIAIVEEYAGSDRGIG